jgi:hypothetical protein
MVAVWMLALTSIEPGPVESTCTCTEPEAPRLTVVVAPPPVWKLPGPDSVSVASVQGAPVIVTVRLVPPQVCRSAPPSIESDAALLTLAA